MKIRKKHVLLNRIKKCWQLYIFMFLPFAYLLIFHYYPMYGAQIAFRDYRHVTGITGSEWVGLKHFLRFINSYQFWGVLNNTLILSFYSLIALFPLRVILALSLNAVRSALFRRSVQMITYMPNFISTIVMVGIMVQFFNPRIGIISRVIQMLGGTNRDLLGIPQYFSHLYVWSGIWQNLGFGTIIFLAALASVDSCQHEAAIIDGASRLQRIRHIDFPAILPTVFILLILDCGRIMSVGFEKVFVMQNDLNLVASEVISTFTYKMGIGGGGGYRANFSFGAAIGLFNSVINFILVVSVNKISKMFNQASLW